MSLKGETKKSQKYHNKTAYEVRFNQKKLEINAKAPLDRMCERCLDQVKWKIQYGKYKPATSLSRCNKCQEKNINKAYRTVCDRCSDKEKCCSKCGQLKGIIENPKQEPKLDRNGVDQDRLKKMEEYMADLRERSKRTIMRKLMKGELEFKDGYFVTVPEGKPLTNLKFKADIDDLDDNWEEGDDDDEDDDFDDDDEDLDDDEDGDEEEKKPEPKGKKGKEEKEVAKAEEAIEAKKEEEPKKVTFSEPAKGNNQKNNKAQNKKQPAKPKKKQDSDDDDDDFDDDDDDDEDF